ncbi:MAG: hypothetical protein EON91_01555 [Brevundimonas sp.]|uniref:TrbC/VirB2 family protein n=1 Tax=Brevundimonas sp. TaxID=1871086 RepID=UPI0012082C84|nr:TrbC/VirB2 family protein [Brevundimonas sp.]RZJ19398.1 MAG: hypothetical protein EON91_01555 [Brevundimonas sp.]
MTGDGETNVLLAAVRWIEALLLGPLATSVAVIAVASIGLLMLAGRVNVRRGLTVILGCFILFGAGAIAQGLRGGVAMVGGDVPTIDVSAPSSDLPTTLPASLANPTPQADPYAGAALRR